MSRSRRAMRPRSPWRPVIGAVVVLLLLGLAADIGLRLLSQTWLSAQLRRTLDLSERPSIELQGFPFLLQVARGSIAEVDVDADRVEVDGLVLRDVAFDLRDVTFSVGDLFRSGSDTVETARGTGSARVTGEDLTAYLNANDLALEVTFLRRRVQVTGTFRAGNADAIARAVGVLRLEEGSLVFVAEEVEVDGAFGVPAERLSFRVPLPSLGRGVSYRGLSIREGSADMTVALRNAVLDLSPEE